MWKNFRRGWSMAKASFAVLRQHPKLVLLPIASGLALLMIIAPLAASLLPQTGPLHAATKGFWALIGKGEANNPMLYIAGFAALYVLTAIAIFFNVALLFCALRCHAGVAPSLRQGLRAALSRLPQILGWALIATTVGMLLSALQEFLENYLSFLGSWLGGLLNFAWAALTYFVVPILVAENVGPIAAIGRSAGIVRAKWGESVSGEARLGLIGILFMLQAALVVAVGAMLTLKFGAAAGLGPILIALGVLYGIATLVTLQALGAIFQAGVYLYAANGAVPSTLDREMLEGTFKPRA